METIIDFLKECFIAYGYNLCYDCSNLKFIVMKHDEYNDFWILTEDFNINKRQKDISLEFERSVCSKIPVARKNVSLLYVKRQDAVNILKEDRDIIEMENNPYHFKKYVLVYTDSSFNDLKVMYGNIYKGMSFSKIVIQKNCFNELKREDSFGAFHLLYSIAHKLPFVVMDVSPKNFVAGIPSFSDEEKQLLKSIEDFDEHNDLESMLHIITNEIEEDENKQA